MLRNRRTFSSGVRSLTQNKGMADGVSLLLSLATVVKRSPCVDVLTRIGQSIAPNPLNSTPQEAASNEPTPMNERINTESSSQNAQYQPTTPIVAKPAVTLPPPPHNANLTPSSVPSSRMSRLFQYSSLAVGVSLGAVSESLKRSVSFDAESNSSSSLVLSPSNIERIVARLSRMRGAALKLGQMLSIQDSNMLPKEFEHILMRVQNAANYMPDGQLMKVMNAELGPEWQQDRFITFDTTPFAAASIGQVHYATIRPPASSTAQSSNQSDQPPLAVAVKIQYPGVATSIESDISYLRTLTLMTSILPRGMYLDNTLRVAKMELSWECDYIREAESMRRMRTLVSDMRGVNVPQVIDSLSTEKVITSEFVQGVPIGSIDDVEQKKRDEIGARMLKLCLEQLFTFRFMQTDPNWSNFLYNKESDTIQLLDFGAAREFPETFTKPYLKLLKAASTRDRAGSIKYSEELGFLTGLESETMINAHLNSLFLLASPFDPARKGTPFNFANQNITSSVRADIPVMLRERLTPPPDESYSLHRSLSGSFLLCSRIGARVDCASLFAEYAARV
ncbi:hypothetical protein HDU77_000378 [Chytriomyces hyalinus]|nr:hypothetical protein HDU77_000378 [Chytriomyces hyalinus]